MLIQNGVSKVDEKYNERRFSPIVKQDIRCDFDLTTRVNSTLVIDNAFYNAIYKLSANKSYAKIPLFFDDNVMKVDERYKRNISDNHIKLAPYNCLEGVCKAAADMYNLFGIQLNQRVNYRLLAQSYFLYSALCVGISNDGEIDLITSCNSVLNSLPIIDKSDAENITSPLADDLTNGIIRCVRVRAETNGYSLQPKFVDTTKRDYLVLPKCWLDFLIVYINNLLKCSVYKVSYYSTKGQIITANASMMNIKGNNKYNFARNYLLENSGIYGVIRCVDVEQGDIVAFPVTRFVRIERC